MRLPVCGWARIINLNWLKRGWPQQKLRLPLIQKSFGWSAQSARHRLLCMGSSGQMRRSRWSSGRVMEEGGNTDWGGVSVERVSGGFLQASVETRVWIIEKGWRPRYWERRLGANRMWIAGPGSAIPHFLFGIIVVWMDQIKFLLRIYSGRPGSTPSTSRPPCLPRCSTVYTIFYHLRRGFFWFATGIYTILI